MTSSAAQRDERNLLRAAKRGNIEARRRVAERYLPLVRRVANRYRDLGLGVDDLVQEGALGLLDAVARYDARRTDDFETFARWRVRRAILNALTDQSRLVRLPKQVVERRRALAHVHDALAAANGHTPSVSDVALAIGYPVAAVTSALDVPADPVSLDAPIADATTLESLVSDPRAPDPEAEALAHEETTLVSEAVRRLPPRQRYVITRHFGFDGEAASLGEIAAEINVSPQRARAIERSALHELADELAPLQSNSSTTQGPPRGGLSRSGVRVDADGRSACARMAPRHPGASLRP